MDACLDTSPIDPAVCPAECNLVNYGDFEDFTTGQNAYYTGFVAPFNSQVIVADGYPVNTVDILSDNNNQYLRMISSTGGYQENALIPLCSAIDPGCSFTVEFKACASTNPAGAQQLAVGVWALTQLPANLEMPANLPCNGTLLDNQNNVIGTCLGVVNVPVNCLSGNVTFPVNPFSLSGSYSGSVTHIWIKEIQVIQEFSTNIYIDDISVTKDCENQITVDPTVISACPGGQVAVDFEVCNSGLQSTPATVTLTPDLSGISGVTLSAYNPEFPGGTATINNLAAGECTTVLLYLDLASSMPGGTPISFPVAIQPNGACIKSSSVQVDFTVENCDSLGCDCPAGSLVIGTPGTETLLSDLIPGQLPASPLTPLNLTIQGVLVIDQLYIFPIGSDICMTSGAEIRVNDSKELQIIGTHVRGCQQRWKSLTALPNSHLYIARNSLIEDGQYAVAPSNKSYINISSSIFNRNYIGLYFDDLSGEFFLNEYNGNTMDCTLPLKPHFDPNDPNDGPWAFAGIKTDGQDYLAIGESDGIYIDKFTNLRNGILTNGCNLTLQESEFRNIERKDYSTSGNAVSASGTGHVFLEDGTCFGNNTVVFDNCWTGISLKNMNARIRNNAMTNVVTGIEVRESPNRDIEICGNNIQCLEHGIKLSFNDPAQRIQVNNNVIDLNLQSPNLKASAISVNESGVPQSNARIEFHDHISIYNARTGIRLSNASGYRLEQNFVAAGRNGTLEYSGISLTHSPNNFLGCNNVDGDFETNPVGGLFGPSGISATASTNVEYDCNDVRDTRLGVHFDMGCEDTRLRGTDFLNHLFGLHYAELAVTGKQPADPPGGPPAELHGNRWNGTWGGPNAIGARHESVLEDFVNQSQYIVLSIPAPFGPENPSSASPDWFFPDPFRDEYTCAFSCDVWLTGDPPIRELDEKIAGGEVDPGVHSAPMVWMLERNLYRKLYNDPSLIQSGSVIDSFYSAKAGTTMARLVEVETAIHDLYDLDTATISQLESYHSQITGKMEEVMVIDSLLQTASGQDSLDLLAQRASTAQAIDSLSQLNTALVNSILQNRSSAADAVIAQNNAIVTSDVWESNEKMVNDILLNTLVKGLLPDSAQTALLDGIARQCPYDGGTAVFRARAILEGLTGQAFDDEVLCAEGQQGLMMPPGVNTIPSKTAVAYPNPAQNAVTVRFAHKTDRGQQMALLSPLGQTIRVYDLPEGDIQFNMDISGMPQGIYYLKVFGNGQETEIIKLVVQER